jgi:membrane associated rhomboid family serine protease
MMQVFRGVVVAIVASFGAVIAWILSSASDVTFTPLLITLVPGLIAGLAVMKVSGSFGWAVFVSGCCNGLVYGALLHRLIRPKHTPTPTRQNVA